MFSSGKILLVLLVTSSLVAHGQGFYNRGAIVSITDQTEVIVPDSLVNFGTLINNGNLTISGAWVNQGVYDAGAGLVDFNSDLVQTINHNDQSFERLVVSGTGEKQFLANLTIESELDLQGSVLKSGNGAKIILNSGTIVSGGSDQSHIVGPVEQTGQGIWNFPIGNGTEFLPVIIEGITDSNASGTLTLHELNPGESLSGTTDVAQLSEERYWELTIQSGSIASSTITLPIRNETGLTGDLSLFAVGESNAAFGDYSSLGQSALTGDATSGSITGDLSPSQNYFAVVVINDIVGIEVFNGVSPGTDKFNDYFRLGNIEKYPDNTVAIYNRWGDKVFEMFGYNNTTRTFTGLSDKSELLPSGTYFYKIDLGDGSKLVTGYLQLQHN